MMAGESKKSRELLFKESCTLFHELKTAWTQKDTKKSGDLLKKLRFNLMELNSLSSGESVTNRQELLVIRGTLEIAAFHSIEIEDIEMFKKFVQQLLTFYEDYPEDKSAESPYKYHILGLHLLCLLAEDRRADFHCAIERIPAEMLTNVYLKHPIQFDQYLAEGSYNKIFLAKENVPAPNYIFFINKLLQTVRSELLSCIEKAYDTVTPKDACRMLFLSNEAELNNVIASRNWILVPGKNSSVYTFDHLKDAKQEGLDPNKIIQMSTDFAKQLEVIV